MAPRYELGGIYEPGQPLSLPVTDESISVRDEIVHLYNQGYQMEQISRDLWLRC